MRKASTPCLLTVFFLAAGSGFLRSADPASLPSRFEKPLSWITAETDLKAEYNYVMTAKLRMLLFWVGRDDVGEGYIRMRERSEEPALESIELKMGSDPGKAPRGINRWGAATEVMLKGLPGETGAFFGFWKASKGETREAMESEFSREASEGRFLFQAVIDRLEAEGVASYVVSFFLDQDLDIHRLEETRKMIIARMREGGDESEEKYFDKTAEGACRNHTGFLFTLKHMIDAVLSGEKASFSSCYIHNGTQYTMTLMKAEPVRSKRVHYKLHSGKIVERTYNSLIKTEFRVRNHTTGNKTSFELFIGTKNSMRGVPVQIIHQPKWWFKVILHLHTD